MHFITCEFTFYFLWDKRYVCEGCNKHYTGFVFTSISPSSLAAVYTSVSIWQCLVSVIVYDRTTAVLEQHERWRLMSGSLLQQTLCLTSLVCLRVGYYSSHELRTSNGSGVFMRANCTDWYHDKAHLHEGRVTGVSSPCRDTANRYRGGAKEATAGEKGRCKDKGKKAEEPEEMQTLSTISSHGKREIAGQQAGWDRDAHEQSAGVPWVQLAVSHGDMAERGYSRRCCGDTRLYAAVGRQRNTKRQEERRGSRCLC